MKEPKQVIVVRKDLNMRKGKIAAQVAHASMKVLLDKMGRVDSHVNEYVELLLLVKKGSPMDKWLNHRFTKVVVSVDSEEELKDIFNKAQAASIPSSFIVDAGLTEFGGVPTATCCAVGPHNAEEIDLICGHLKLL